MKTQTMLEKLKSRKFWVTFVAAAIVLFAESLGLDGDQTMELVAIAASYVFGQGYVDGKAVESKALAESKE